MAMLENARTLLDELAKAPTGPVAGPKWKSLHLMLKKAQCDQMRLARAIAERNVEVVRGLLDIAAAAPPPAPRGSYATLPDGSPAPRSAMQPLVNIRAEKPTPQQLKTALAAFKKRLKLTKLDQESRIGRSPLTGGIKSNVLAILPPNFYPKVYWEELEKQGQIRNTGGGFYELVEKAKPIKGEGRVDVKGEVIPLAELPPDPVAPGTGESQADEADVADDAEQHAETGGEQ